MQLDFRKAFDTIEWDFIQKTISLFNFGDDIKRWISTFYAHSASAVLNKGFCTNYFQLLRGVRQGCPLSPCSFILAVELLACKIRQDKEIHGITVFRKEFKIGQFADDTTLFSGDKDSVRRAIAVLNDFGDLSGLRLNPSKTKALWLGPWRHRKEKPFGFKWPERPIRALGIFISYDTKQNDLYNFKTKIQKIETVHDIWQSRNLTLFGRCLITKSLALSQLIHPFSILDIPKDYIKAADSVIFQFIWRKKKDKIKRKVMLLDFDQGGLRAPSVETKSLNRLNR